MELDVALKMLCLASPLCKCYKGACDNQTRDEHYLEDDDHDNE